MPSVYNFNKYTFLERLITETFPFAHISWNPANLASLLKKSENEERKLTFITFFDLFLDNKIMRLNRWLFVALQLLERRVQSPAMLSRKRCLLRNQMRQLQWSFACLRYWEYFF